MKETYFSASDVAEMLKISYDNALDFIKYSGVEFVTIGRQYRVAETKLKAFLYQKKAQAGKPVNTITLGRRG